MSRRTGDLLALFISVSVPLAVGGLSAIPTASAIPTWYQGLKKPDWTPPPQAFGPVWTLLYAAMGVSAWLVARDGWNNPRARQALGLFAGQLALNGLWSLIFFGLRAPGLALAELAALWGLIAATMVQFYRLRPAAGLLLLPYLLWTTFAGALNASVWWLNRES